MKLQVENLGKVSPTTEGYWDSRKSYNRLCIVTHKYDPFHFRTYISRRPVPAGINITDDRYWMPTACFVDGKFDVEPIPRVVIDEILLGTRHCVSKAWYDGLEFKPYPAPISEPSPALTPGFPAAHPVPNPCPPPRIDSIMLDDLMHILNEPVECVGCECKIDNSDSTDTDTDTSEENKVYTDDEIAQILEYIKEHRAKPECKCDCNNNTNS